MFNIHQNQLIQKYFKNSFLKKLDNGNSKPFSFQDTCERAIEKLQTLNKNVYLGKDDKNNPFNQRVLISNKTIYLLLNKIGEGETAIVFKSLNLLTGEFVAIKNMDATNLEIKNACEREITISKRIGFANDSTMVEYHYNEDEENEIENPIAEFFLVMKLYNYTLETYIDNTHLTYEQKLDMAFKTSCALEHLHNNGIIHNDIQPSNIFIGNNNSIVIGDFGFAKEKNKINKKRADIFRLVTNVLHYILTGQVDKNLDVFLQLIKSDSLKKAIFEPTTKVASESDFPVSLTDIKYALKEELSILIKEKTIKLMKNCSFKNQLYFDRYIIRKSHKMAFFHLRGKFSPLPIKKSILKMLDFRMA